MNYEHPGYKKPYPIATVLRDLASQEGCDGEPYDVMIAAAGEIARLTSDLATSRAETAMAFEVAAQTVDTTGDSAVTEALGQRLCCSGHHCGCQGADVGAFLVHLIRENTPAHATAALAARDKAKDDRIAELEAELGRYLRCEGCGSVTDDPEKQLAWIARHGGRSCCPERKMVPIITIPSPQEVTQ